MNPICSKCMYLSNEQVRFRPCPRIPIFHRDMLCSNTRNAIKDHVSGEPYKPFCEEVNRHGECLVYMPKNLEKPEINFFEDDNLVAIYGTNPFVITTDGTDPSDKSEVVGAYDEKQRVFTYELALEHTCDVKVACIEDGVISDVVELHCEVPDVPAIEFDKTTNTVTIKSYNKVFFTIDGSKVTEESPVYESPFVIDQNTTVKCRSYAREDLSEEVFEYCVSIEPPVISFDGDTNTVSIESDDKVLYSVDGSDIYDDADEYTAPFTITDNTLVKAAAIVDGELSEQVELECRVPTVPVIEYDREEKLVTITSDDEILYTTDGSNVKKKSTVYTAPFKISETVTVKAKSLTDGRLSEQSELECEVIPAPEITFDPDNNTVSITGTEKILYSTDGSKIYDDSDEYDYPFVIEKNTTVRAACIKNGYLSDEVSLVCNVPSEPVISFDARTKTVTITGENTILYTTDGSDVKKKDSEYTKPFKITETTTVKAKSIVDGRMSEQAEMVCDV